MKSVAESIRVAVVSDLKTGGAAIACSRLVDALGAMPGIEPVRLAASASDDSGAVSRWAPLGWLGMFRLARAWRGSEVPARRALDALHERLVYRQLSNAAPDIVNLHNLHERMSFRFAARVAARWPVVWTLHDLWPLTGYCCYSYACRKFTSGCRGECPQWNRWGVPTESAAAGWRRRQRLYARRSLTFVSPSRWLAAQAEERGQGRFRVVHVPYGIDAERFRPAPDRRALRVALGWPPDRPLVLAGAQSVDDERKGARWLIEAWPQVRAPGGVRPQRAFFGLRQPSFDVGDALYLGSIRDEALLRLYYAAADVFVLPSLADNLPNTLLESLACGTPCVAFDVGGCPEVVRPGVTGFTAPAKDAAALAASINRILAMAPDAYERLRGDCRRVAMEDYDDRRQAQRYGALFAECLSARGSGDVKPRATENRT